jgi:hypothetical protein
VDVNEKVAPAQTVALAVRGNPNPDSYACMKSIKQTSLGGERQPRHHLLHRQWVHPEQNLPDAQPILHPDFSRGPQYQYPDLFLRHVILFLQG